MALTAQEKNAIASGLSVTGQALIVEEAALGLTGAGLLGLVFAPLALGLAAEFGRVRFPRISPGDILRLARAGQEGFVVSSDPFFGDAVISTPDQARNLTELVRNSAIRRVAALQDTSRAFLQRRLLIEGLAESAPGRGFATAVDPSLRGGVFRASADDPLQFIEGDFLA